MIKKTFLALLYTLFLTGYASAYCNFEAVSMESSLNALQPKVNDAITQNTEGVFEAKVSSNDICNDPKFRDIDLIFKFIDNKLHQIKFVTRVLSDGHLRNLKYYYGEPLNVSDKYSNQYYHWDESFKHIFFIVEKSQDSEGSLAYLEIVSDKYKKVSKEYNSDAN